jgi:hypothetical protein
MRKHHYRYVTGLTHGRSPNPDDTVRLTAVGMFHAGQMDTNGLMQAFLAALTAVTKAQRSVEPKPTAAVPVVLLGDRLTKEAAVATGINIAPRQLYELLDHELATWTGLMQNGEDWQWDVTQLYLNPYRNVTTAPQYLAALETAVSEPPVPTEAAILSPLALPDALDHLDLAWRLVTGPEAGDHWPSWPPRDHDTTGFDPGGIESRCSGLADLLNGFTTAVKEDKSAGTRAAKSLQGLRASSGFASAIRRGGPRTPWTCCTTSRERGPASSTVAQAWTPREHVMRCDSIFLTTTGQRLGARPGRGSASFHHDPGGDLHAFDGWLTHPPGRAVTETVSAPPECRSGGTALKR